MGLNLLYEGSTHILANLLHIAREEHIFCVHAGQDMRTLPSSGKLSKLSLSGQYVLVTAPNCDYGQAAVNVILATEDAGVEGIIVVAQPDDYAQAIGNTASGEYFGTAVISISYQDGAEMIALFDQGAESMSISLGQEMVPGYFMAVDSERKLYELGYWWTYTLNYITTEARYLQYMSKV